MGFFISANGTKARRIVRSGSKVFAELFSKSDQNPSQTNFYPMQLTHQRPIRSGFKGETALIGADAMHEADGKVQGEH